MKLYHGTSNLDPLIPAKSYVTPMFSRAVKYARYPGNGPGIALGYVYELSADTSQVDWDDREDCSQGTLKTSVRALAVTTCDLPLDVINRESPIRIRLNGSSVWNTSLGIKEINWVSVAHPNID